MSDIEASPPEAAAAVNDALSDVDDIPSDAEASTSAAPSKSAGPGRPKGKSTTAAPTTKDAEQGLQSFLLPKSTGQSLLDMDLVVYSADPRSFSRPQSQRSSKVLYASGIRKT